MASPRTALTLPTASERFVLQDGGSDAQANRNWSPHRSLFAWRVFAGTARPKRRPRTSQVRKALEANKGYPDRKDLKATKEVPGRRGLPVLRENKVHRDRPGFQVLQDNKARRDRRGLKVLQDNKAQRDRRGLPVPLESKVRRDRQDRLVQQENKLRQDRRGLQAPRENKVRQDRKDLKVPRANRALQAQLLRAHQQTSTSLGKTPALRTIAIWHATQVKRLHR